MMEQAIGQQTQSLSVLILTIEVSVIGCDR